MKKYQIGNVDITDSLWRESQIHWGWTDSITAIDRRMRAIDPRVRFEHHGPRQPSGCTWELWADELENIPKNWGRPGRYELWTVALSYQGPLITGLSWRRKDKTQDVVTSPELVGTCVEMARDLRLTYLDAHELRACEIPRDELNEEASRRLSDSALPNAFNLLFYE